MNLPGHNLPWWRRVLRSRLFLAGGLLAVGFAGWSLLRELDQGRAVSSQLADLESQIQSLEKQNDEYVGLIGRLGTPGFVEREARLKLGYQKPGEQVLVLRDDNPAAAPAAVSAPADPNLTNPQKWWRYFFGEAK